MLIGHPDGEGEVTLRAVAVAGDDAPVDAILPGRE